MQAAIFSSFHGLDIVRSIAGCRYTTPFSLQNLLVYDICVEQYATQLGFRGQGRRRSGKTCLGRASNVTWIPRRLSTWPSQNCARRRFPSIILRFSNFQLFSLLFISLPLPLLFLSSPLPLFNFLFSGELLHYFPITPPFNIVLLKLNCIFQLPLLVPLQVII